MTLYDHKDVLEMTKAGKTMPEIMAAMPWLRPEDVAAVMVSTLTREKNAP